MQHNDNEVVKPEISRVFITVLIMAAAFMQVLDTTIANVALPRMQGSLSATQDQIAWVLTSYIVAAAIMTPLTGWLAGRFGRKYVFLISVAVFTLTSALCGLATSLPEVVIFRIFQGMAGAALLPLSQAILLDINPPENYGKAMAIWGIGVTLGPALGPVIGGWLTDNYNWRWVFYVNVPVGVFVFFGLLAVMDDTERNLGRFDFFGFTSLAFSLGALQLMLDRGERQDWFESHEIITYAVVMTLSFYMFIIHTLSYTRPFLSPELFINRNFVIANIYIFIVGLLLYATLALTPPMLQTQMNYPVYITGLVTAPRGFGIMISMIVVGKVIGKIDVRVLIAFGLLLNVIALLQMTQFNLLMDSRLVITSGLIQGFGIGFCFVPLTTVAFGTLAPNLRNEGTAFFNLMRNIGSAIGISVLEALTIRKTQIMHSYLGENITIYNLNDPVFAANNINMATQLGLLKMDKMITDQATMIAYINDYKMMAFLALAVIPLTLLLDVSSSTTNADSTVVME